MENKIFSEWKTDGGTKWLTVHSSVLKQRLIEDHLAQVENLKKIINDQMSKNCPEKYEVISTSINQINMLETTILGIMKELADRDGKEGWLSIKIL
jgi:hypothetical protein